MATWKTYLQVTGCIFLLCLGIPLRRQDPDTIELENQYQMFLQKFNKTYSSAEYQLRLQAFNKSLTEINKLNSMRKSNSSALYGVTKYSDMSTEEFTKNHLQFALKKRLKDTDSDTSDEDHSSEHKRKIRSLRKLPLKVDWRQNGYVTEIKNQKLCGACWAFCTIENIETMYAIKTGKIKKLSVQEMIDCAENGNSGCNGGDMCLLLSWLRDHHIVIEEEADYPLRLRNENCKIKNSTGIQIKDFICESVADENLIMTLLAKNGPVAVAINALSWQNYLGGVIQYHCDSSVTHLNHAVQIVGYDRTADIPYYIVRNSWGKDFGDNGYLYIAIGNNLCGLANEVSALTLL